jgi:RNA-directed DNA polymerase
MKTLDNTLPIYTPKILSLRLGIPLDVLLDLSNTAHKKYKPFTQKKESGGERIIDNPNPELKAPQKKINKRILSQFILPPEILGGVKGYSIKDYAQIHLNQPQVVCLDIKNCFPSVSYKSVFEVFRDQLKYSKSVSSILTKLTTLNGYIPQGSPTSTTLLNIIISPMASEISELCKNHKLKVSFWVDDITISGVDARDIIQTIVPIIHKHGFALKSKKTTISYGHEKQTALNLAINNTVKINSQRYNAYISELYDPNINIESLKGKIEHMNYINKKQAKRFLKFAKKRLADRLIEF